MANKEIKKIKVGTETYDIVDEFARESIPEGEVDITLTSTSISDGTTTLDVAGLINAAIGNAIADIY